MPLPNGFFNVPPGKVAAVVTYLEMLKKPSLRQGPSQDSWRLEHANFPDLHQYRALFRLVGQDWLWFSRLYLNDDELAQILNHPLYDTYKFVVDDQPQGLLELDYRTEGECEISFIGLAGDMIGKGAGRWLMNRSLDIAWSRPIRRLWLHTCTFDHPRAVQFYVRSGFRPYHRQIEIADDPRLDGLLPITTAPHVPLIREYPSANPG